MTPPAIKTAQELRELPPISTLDLPSNTVYRIARVLFKIFFRLIGDLETSGQENIPKRGPVLFASNHQSHLDPPLVGTDMDRITWYMAKEELFENRYWGWLMRQLHGFPVKRHTADRAALRKALKLLERDETVTIFLEGERSRDGKLKRAEPGVAMIALRSRAPVIPIALMGTGEILPPGGNRLKRGKLIVKYGKPVDLSGFYGRRDSKDTLQEVSDRIMAAIADLMGVPPPEKIEELENPAEV